MALAWVHGAWVASTIPRLSHLVLVSFVLYKPESQEPQVLKERGSALEISFPSHPEPVTMLPQGWSTLL